jgi:methylglyoxal synthase
MRRVLALAADNAKKDEIVQLIQAHKEELAKIDLIATQGTGQYLREKTGRTVTLLLTEARGGEQQIGALVANGEVNAVIYLRDPVNTNSYESRGTALLKICDVYKVPIATNTITAEAVLHLLAEHPEALGGHHLAAQFLEENAGKHASE